MECLKFRKTEWLTALGSAALVLLGAADARAELLHGIVAPEEAFQATDMLVRAGIEKKAFVCFAAHGTTPQPSVSHGPENWQAVAAGIRGEWESLRRELVATAVTMFFIRGGTTPSTPAPTISNTPPPSQSNNPPGGNSNPPPPGGNGESPPGDPGNPPAGTPEPASFVLALLGAGLAAGSAWRKRRVTN